VTTAFSTYLIGLRMITFGSSWLGSELETQACVPSGQQSTATASAIPFNYFPFRLRFG
jgi:hypothetical protein